MLPPDLDITSPTNQELKNDAEWGDPQTIEQPMYEVLAHVELLFHAANDHMRSLGRLLGGDQPNWYGHIAVARAVVETASRLWWLTEAHIDPLERVRRHLMEQQYEVNHQEGLFGGPFRSMPADVHDAGMADLAARRRRLLGWALRCRARLLGWTDPRRPPETDRPAASRSMRRTRRLPRQTARLGRSPRPTTTSSRRSHMVCRVGWPSTSGLPIPRQAIRTTCSRLVRSGRLPWWP